MERPRKTVTVLTVCAFTVREESAFHSPRNWNMYTCILFHMKLYFFRFFSMLFKINNANKSPPLLFKSSNITGGKVTLNRGHCAPKCQSELESIWKLALVMWHLLGLWHLLLCSCVHSSPICFPHLSELMLTDLDPLGEWPDPFRPHQANASQEACRSAIQTNSMQCPMHWTLGLGQSRRLDFPFHCGGMRSFLSALCTWTGAILTSPSHSKNGKCGCGYPFLSSLKTLHVHPDFISELLQDQLCAHYMIWERLVSTDH